MTLSHQTRPLWHEGIVSSVVASNAAQGQLPNNARNVSRWPDQFHGDHLLRCATGLQRQLLGIKINPNVAVDEFHRSNIFYVNLWSDGKFVHVRRWRNDPTSHGISPAIEFREVKSLAQYQHGMRVVWKERVQPVAMSSSGHNRRAQENCHKSGQGGLPNSFGYSCGSLNGLAASSIPPQIKIKNAPLPITSHMARSINSRPDATDSHTASHRAVLRRRGTAQKQIQFVASVGA